MVAYPPRVYKQNHKIDPGGLPRTIDPPPFQPFSTQQHRTAVSSPKGFAQWPREEAQGNIFNGIGSRGKQYGNPHTNRLEEPSTDEFGRDLARGKCHLVDILNVMTQKRLVASILMSSSAD